MWQPEISLDAAGLTHVGRERSRNEDQFLVARLERNLRVMSTSVRDVAPMMSPPRDGTLLLVADGMGGGADGDVASSVAVRSVIQTVITALPWSGSLEGPPSGASIPTPQSTLPGVRRGLTSALVEGDVAVRREAARTGTDKPMGTTLTVAYIQWPYLYVAHVGDSRAYLWRGKELLQLTTDHTLAEKLKERTDITIDDSSPWHHVLWNALGAGETSAVEPEVHRHQLEEGDVLMLCSDGLTKHVEDRVIGLTLDASTAAGDACERLVNLANVDGGTDNITVVACYCLPLDFSIDSDAPTLAVPAVDTKAITAIRQPAVIEPIGHDEDDDPTRR